MATLYVDTDAVSPTPPTYSSLAAAVAALPATLDEPYVIECSGAANDNTAVTVSRNASATNTLTIIGNYSGVWDDSNYTLGSTASRSGEWLSITSRHITVKGIQIRHHYAFSATVIGGIYAYGSTTGPVTIDGCHIRHTILTAGNVTSILMGSSNIDALVINNVLEVASANNGAGYAIGSAGATSGRAANNVCIGFHNGIVTTGTVDVSNNICFTTSDCFVGNYSGNYNISGDATAPGANSLINQVSADIFTDPANGDFTLKTGSSAIGAGADLSAYFTTDITGATRTAPWDIGAFKYDAGGSVLLPPTNLRVVQISPTETRLEWDEPA